jgi:hypothetical protein
MDLRSGLTQTARAYSATMNPKAAGKDAIDIARLPELLGKTDRN